MLYVGYTNRMLGEHFCSTTIDGGPQLSFMVHFVRAESAFTEALAIAQYQKNVNLTNAAYAGRASVRTWRGDWTGAAADAAQVPATFVYSTPFNTVDQTQSNSLAIATVDVTRRNFTLWNTFYGDNFDQFKDPRTPYRKNPDIAQRTGLGYGSGSRGREGHLRRRPVLAAAKVPHRRERTLRIANPLVDRT